MSAVYYHQNVEHAVAIKVTSANVGGGETIVERLPACFVTGVDIIKKTDFNGTSPVLDVGVNYPSSTTDDPDGLVDGHDLSSSTAQGLVAGTMKDTAIAYLEEEADLVVTLTGTTVTAGEAVVVVKYVPQSNTKNASTL